MSWQSYVDEHLLCELPHGGQLSSAAIVGQDGGVWAQSDGFPEVSAEQVRAQAAAPRLRNCLCVRGCGRCRQPVVSSSP